jgi:hypothetical protein
MPEDSEPIVFLSPGSIRGDGSKSGDDQMPPDKFTESNTRATSVLLKNSTKQLREGPIFAYREGFFFLEKIAEELKLIRKLW